MMAIKTRYHGPTNSRGSRVSAASLVGRVSIAWDDELGVPGNHAAACKALVVKLGWDAHVWIAGEMKDGYVFVSSIGEPVVMSEAA